MKSLSLILRIVAIIAAVAAAGLFFVTQGKLAEKQTALETAQKATQDTQAQLVTTNDKAASLQSSLNNESAALAESKRNLEAMGSEMHTARGEVTRTQQQLREIKKEAAELEDTAKRLRTELVTAEQNLAGASKEGEIAQLEERVAELAKANTVLQGDLDAERASKTANAKSQSNAAVSNTSSGALPGINNYQVNTTPAVEPASIGTATTIAAVRAASGLIILNATPELGLTPGTQITLVKDLKALAKVQIVSNEGGLAVGNLLPGAKTRELIPGASVKILR
jgi:myosin heavy subunit